MAILFVVALVFIFSAVGLLAYRQPTNSKIVNGAIRIFPYPAAIVNGDMITLYDWQYEYFAWKKASELEGSQVSDDQIRSDVLNKLVYDRVLLDFARKYDIKVTDEEMDYELINLAKQDFGTVEKFEQEIKETFGWSLSEFKSRILYNSLVNQKLTAMYAADTNNKDQTKKQVESIREQLVAGGDFAVLAKQYSQDPGSAATGGDLGWFKRGVMVKEFEDAAFALEPGVLSEIIETQYGYHILLVTEKKAATADSEEEVKVSHILISLETFQTVLDRAVDEAKVVKFIKVQKNN